MSIIDLDFTLDEVYRRERGRIFMTGIQALVRLPMMQRRLDRAAGLNTAGLVSGYRGSPLGGYDQQLWRAETLLKAEDVLFQPGLNEDLAATALWGAQQHRAFGPTRADGVFGIWYGKGPGVDRTGDVFRTANVMGTAPLGGVLAVAGDDHAAQSSTFPHQTDGIFQAVSMPVLQPSSLPEILSLGLAGFALSRFSGLWVAMKTIAEVVESAGAFDLPDPYPRFARPADFELPPHGLNWDATLTWPAGRAELERRLIEERLPAALAWARANRLDRAVVEAPRRRIGLVTVGKAHQDVMQALSDLGLDAWTLSGLGVGVYKVAMSWPLEGEGVRRFAEGLSELIVVEEKRGVVEAQVKSALYDLPADRRPRVFGKAGEAGRPLLPEVGELSPLMVARAIAGRLLANGVDAALAGRLAELEARAKVPAPAEAAPARRPYFCSGCPHNTSTQVPDGSIAGGGIGCHVMALAQPERRTPVFSQMGGEGLQWVGAAPFSQTRHLFQNLGDGTYQHSGLLAIRAAVAARTNITFKILYNDAVAMTGGQPAEGAIDPARITRQLAAEGVGRIALVSDAPEKWTSAEGLAEGVEVHGREALDAVQKTLREVPGVTAIVYEQTCAAEKRRRRKKGDFPDPDRRLFINSRVCEGCGDCSVQSNCIAVEPLETTFGRKRKVNQSACNKDFSCAKGFCPSFVEVDGPVLRKPAPDRLAGIEAERFATLPSPELPDLSGVYNIYVAGIGGLGVLTVGALLGAAAHLEGKGVSVLDFTGMAQKNGAVVSQIRIAARPSEIHAARIGPAETDLLLATDMVAASTPEAMKTLSRGRTAAVINLDAAPTADVVGERDASLPTALMSARLRRAAGIDRSTSLRAAGLAQGLFGDTVAANTLMLGYAWQKGLAPLSAEAIARAIELNGAAVALNKRAFNWGRMAAIDLAEVERIAGLAPAEPEAPEGLDALIDRRAADLAAYQDAAYADRYRALVSAARAAGRRGGDIDEAFARAVAVNAYRLMAYKDEYEVARLYADPAFKAELAGQFSSTKRLSVWLSPPLISKIDPATGRPAKRKFGPWVFTLFKLLAGLKRLRGTRIDPFGATAERRAERRLMADYLMMVEGLCAGMTAARLPASIKLAQAPSEIRGYGPVKEAAIAAHQTTRTALLAELARADQPAAIAAE
ncbi:MAG: indolepyruvate ferredoxin oxidoreductase family protein [Caulobacteraceae bacterium]|nr:indolepyruvate ferredoxin oxidoreductase family protein [Caulobacteraceae bacterium]